MCLKLFSSRNISVFALLFMFSQAVKKFILQCDTSVLSDNVLEQLITYLPPPDQLKRLSELNCDPDELTEAEHFAVTVRITHTYHQQSGGLPIYVWSLSCFQS